MVIFLRHTDLVTARIHAGRGEHRDGPDKLQLRADGGVQQGET